MKKHSILLAFALTLSASGTTALAGKPCPWNDKEQPEKSRICKAGTIQVCHDGQWVSLGIKCTAKLHQDDRADAAGLRRLLGEPPPQNDRIVARIAPVFQDPAKTVGSL